MNWASDADYSAPAGMVTIRAGDVMEIDGELLVCDMVNDCRARLRPVLGQTVKMETRFGKQAEFTVDRGSVNIATHVEPGSIVERLGEDGLKQFLASQQTARRRGAVEGAKETNTNDKYERIILMAAKLRALKGEKKTTKARGGLAADMAATPTAEEKATAKALKAQQNADAKAAAKAGKVVANDGNRKGNANLFGFAVTAVIRKLKQAGCGSAHVLAIFAARNVQIGEHTVKSISGNYKPETAANMNKEQVEELVGSAPDPKAAKS